MHDIAIVGGGLGGAALAATMAASGADVVVLERDTVFRDRVRGESILSWGTAEIEKLGLTEVFKQAGGHELPYWLNQPKGKESKSTHLPSTTKIGTVPLGISHPRMQETLLTHAADQGARVMRGARVTSTKSGKIEYSDNGVSGEIYARLVVSTEGRNAPARKLFPPDRHNINPDIRSIAGVLFDDMPAPSDANIISVDEEGHLVILFPQGEGRVRAYISFPVEEGRAYSGSQDYKRFKADSIELSGWDDYYGPAIPTGPLATFKATENWIDHPYDNGVVLVGDAAATSDPTFGQGLSLTLRDVRTLSESLKTEDNWDIACHQYAESHDRYWNILHTYTGWVSDLWHSVGSEASERRVRAIENRKSNPEMDPSCIQEGPDTELTEELRKWFFGED
ncbi:FAD-dependent monooxygenase [Dehalococcoides mccartyi]|nr:FAD-dependent monooxygenase [Dehalococcoides mccartyi]